MYKSKLISDGFWSIEETGVRSFLIEGTDSAMLVDTGFGSGDLKSFAETLTGHPVFLVNTHCDVDHIGCNEQFNKVIMHPLELEYYRMKNPDYHTSVEFIEEGDVLDLGKRAFTILHIPGHTPGSIALLDRENKLLISGDSIQNGAVFMFGPGRDMSTYIDSMRKLDKMKSDFQTILASHGENPVPSDIIPELITGAQMVLEGKIRGEKPPRDLPCKLYSAGRAKFLCS